MPMTSHDGQHATQVCKRPSSVRRRANLHILVLAFAVGPMAIADVMAILHCSQRAAYHYVNALLDETVIHGRLAACGPGLYWLSDDAPLVKQFLKHLDSAHLGQSAADEIASTGLRDPLVAALFGTRQTKATSGTN